MLFSKRMTAKVHRKSISKILQVMLISWTAILFGSGCGPIGSFQATAPKAMPDETSNKNQEMAPSSPQNPIGEVTAQEKEDDYSNPFAEINGQFDENSPEVKNDFTPHGDVKDQAVGTYAGDTAHLENPSNLFLKQLSYAGNSPFKIIYPSRKTFFGTADMIEMIDYLAHYLKSLVPRLKLLIGDISAEHGGQLGGHGSHRIGMDADIAYLEAGNHQREGFESMIGQNLAQKILLKEQLHLFEFAILTKRVDRIFVHPQIKIALCDTARKLGAFEPGHENTVTLETLRRLIPEPNHGNHFHLRLKCSKAQPRCIPMVDPANHSGC